jgi:hypothetical protein
MRRPLTKQYEGIEKAWETSLREWARRQRENKPIAA